MVAISHHVSVLLPDSVDRVIGLVNVLVMNISSFTLGHGAIFRGPPASRKRMLRPALNG